MSTPEPSDNVALERPNQRPAARPPQEGNLGPFRRFSRRFTTERAAGRHRAGSQRSPKARADEQFDPEYGDSF